MDQESNASSCLLDQTYGFICHPPKSKWHQYFGYQEEPHNAKIMFKNSKLLPPPQKVQEAKQKMYKKTVAEHKLKLKLIFRKIFYYNLETSQANALYGMNCNFMTKEQFMRFISQIEPQIQAKFKKRLNQSLILLKEAEYEKMEQVFEKVESWLIKTEQKVKQKYEAQAERCRYMRQIQEYQKLCKTQIVECETSDIEHSSDKTVASLFNMKYLELEVTKMMHQEETFSRSESSTKSNKSERERSI